MDEQLKRVAALLQHGGIWHVRLVGSSVFFVGNSAQEAIDKAIRGTSGGDPEPVVRLGLEMENSDLF